MSGELIRLCRLFNTIDAGELDCDGGIDPSLDLVMCTRQLTRAKLDSNACSD